MGPKDQLATQLKELNDIVIKTNEKSAGLEEIITSNHNELLSRMVAVEKNSNDALEIAKANEIAIANFTASQENIKVKVDDNQENVLNIIAAHKTEVDNRFKKSESQMKGILIEFEDLRNCSMRNNLIFKGLKETPKEDW